MKGGGGDQSLLVVGDRSVAHVVSVPSSENPWQKMFLSGLPDLPPWGGHSTLACEFSLWFGGKPARDRGWMILIAYNTPNKPCKPHVQSFFGTRGAKNRGNTRRRRQPSEKCLQGGCARHLGVTFPPCPSNVSTRGASWTSHTKDRRGGGDILVGFV